MTIEVGSPIRTVPILHYHYPGGEVHASTSYRATRYETTDASLKNISTRQLLDVASCGPKRAFPTFANLCPLSREVGFQARHVEQPSDRQ